MTLLWGVLGSKSPCSSFPFCGVWKCGLLLALAGCFALWGPPGVARWQVALAGEKNEDNLGKACNNRPSRQRPALVTGSRKERALVLIWGTNWGCQSLFPLSMDPDILPCPQESLGASPFLPQKPTWTVDFLLFWSCLQPRGLPGFRASTPPSFGLHCQPWPPPQPLHGHYPHPRVTATSTE